MPGHLPSTVRRAVFDNAEVPADLAPFVDIVARYAHRLTDGDVAALARAGYQLPPTIRWLSRGH